MMPTMAKGLTAIIDVPKFCYGTKIIAWSAYRFIVCEAFLTLGAGFALRKRFFNF
jgi:hypothetical protein